MDKRAEIANCAVLQSADGHVTSTHGIRDLLTAQGGQAKVDYLLLIWR
jgi:hypothetical protein